MLRFLTSTAGPASALLLSLLTCHAWGSGARAATFTIDENTIKLEGEILPGDAETFVYDAYHLDRAIMLNKRYLMLYLDSIGGDFDEGIKLAAAVNQLSSPKMPIHTAVLWGAKCVSSCISVFAAGERKFVGATTTYKGKTWPRGKLYVHSVTSNTDERQSAGLPGIEDDTAMASTVLWARILKRFGTPPSVITKLITTPGSRITPITDADLEAWGVEFLHPDD